MSAGSTGGALDGHAFAGGLSDAFLVKYDAAGTKLWSSQLGTTDDDDAFGITLDASGNVYITGDTFGVLPGAPLGTVNQGLADLFLAKYSDGGSAEPGPAAGLDSERCGVCSCLQQRRRRRHSQSLRGRRHIRHAAGRQRPFQQCRSVRKHRRHLPDQVRHERSTVSVGETSLDAGNKPSPHPLPSREGEFEENTLSPRGRGLGRGGKSR